MQVDNEYYTPEHFRDKVLRNFSSSYLKIYHFNCRSLKCNFDALVNNIDAIQDTTTIVGVSETWLKENEKLYVDIPNYEFVGNCRREKRGGGVGLYIRDTIRFKRRIDLDIFCDCVESIFIEVFTKNKKCIIAVIYRPPNQSCQDFLVQIQSSLDIISHEKKECIIMGDFNIDLLNKENSSSHDFVNTFLSFSYVPQISKPTRITHVSATIVDNILYNYTENVVKAGIISTDVSDHLSPFMIVQFGSDEPDESLYEYTKVDFSDNNIEMFCSQLVLIDWESLNDIRDVNKRYDAFLLLYKQLYDKYFPATKVTKRVRKSQKPWLSKEIKKCIKRKNILYRKYLKNRTLYRFDTYKTCRNTVNAMIRKAKREYYNRKFEFAKNNMKVTWKVIYDVMNKKRATKNDIISIEHDGENITDKQDIANIFNEYFVSIGLKLQNKIHNGRVGQDQSVNQWLKGHFPSSMYFRLVTINDVIDIVKTLECNKSPGYDGIHPRVLKRSIFVIAKPLCNIINLAIESGIFPDSLKIAKVIPVFKSGDKSLLTNYRPISVLSVFSKIFEKIICNQLMSFIDRNNILYRKQYGFRKRHSTHHALIDFTEKIANAFENNNFLIGLFLDLSKAFDCIDHAILINKLRFYGIRGVAINLIISYLFNRKQFVNIGNLTSNNLDILLGVPQGSNLGPLLFLLYVNDLPNVSDVLSFILFADDTSLFLAGNNPRSVSLLLNNELEKMYFWFLANRLLINFSKTNYMVFKIKNKNVDVDVIKVHIANNEINMVDSVKFLGLIIDSKLTWKQHINEISRKISCVIGVLNKIKFMLPLSVLANLYNSMILPYLTYCNIIWGNCANYLLQQLFLLQKRAIRIITKSPYLAHSNVLFSQLNILNIYDLHLYLVAIFMFLYMKNILPENFNNFFTPQRNINKYVTRNADNLYLPNYRYKFSRTMIKYRGPLVWNMLQHDLKDCFSLSTFKRKYKLYLIDHNDL